MGTSKHFSLSLWLFVFRQKHVELLIFFAIFFLLVLAFTLSKGTIRVTHWTLLITSAPSLFPASDPGGGGGPW